jgi:cob(I)alamin adenosyltransferase
MSKGLVQVYTGDGKGKTTAALGLAVRAIGWGKKVIIIQFIKGNQEVGEIKIGQKKLKELKIEQFRQDNQYFIKKPDQGFIPSSQKALKRANQVIQSNQFDLVILDEINNALYYHLIKTQDVLDLIKNKPPQVELILTGRNAPQEIIKAAHLATEMKQIKHPFQKGIKARQGIEF